MVSVEWVIREVSDSGPLARLDLLAPARNGSEVKPWQRFDAYASRYDQARPAPPAAFLDLVIERAQAPRPALVIDLGCGTGLSTRVWAERSERVMGVDASASMIQQARRATEAGNVSYEVAASTQLPFDGGVADAVTCVQAFHWMDPAPTLAEIARVLRPGGVFAALDFDYPPAVSPKLSLAFVECVRKVVQASKLDAASLGTVRWAKTEHLARIRESRAFASCEEITLQSTEQGDAERFIAMATTLSDVGLALETQSREARRAVDELRAAARTALGDTSGTWTWTSRVRLGVRV